jgi:hypothetical protein
MDKDAVTAAACSLHTAGGRRVLAVNVLPSSGVFTWNAVASA